MGLLDRPWLCSRLSRLSLRFLWEHLSRYHGFAAQVLNVFDSCLGHFVAFVQSVDYRQFHWYVSHTFFLMIRNELSRVIGSVKRFGSGVNTNPIYQQHIVHELLMMEVIFRIPDLCSLCHGQVLVSEETATSCGL